MPAAVHRLGHLGKRQLRQTHRHAELAGQLGCQRHVLVGEAQRERRRVVFAGQELVDYTVERAPAADCAGAHRLPQLQRLHPALDAHGKDLGQRRLNGIAGAVVHELGHRAGADRADVAGRVAEGVEHGLVPVEDRLVAANPDRKLAGLGARGPAADRCVEQMHPALGKDLLDPAHQGRRVGGEIEARRALLQSRDQALCAECDRLDLRRSGEREEDDLASLGHGSGRGCPLRAGLNMVARVLALHIVHHEIVARLLQIGGHARTHGAKADEPDVHITLPASAAPAAMSWSQYTLRRKAGSGASDCDHGNVDSGGFPGDWSRGAAAEPSRRRQLYLKTWMIAGPRITTNSTGRKKTIIGTVSFGGRAAAFFSASAMRISRFSFAITRSAVPTGVP